MASSPELFVVCKNCQSQVSPYITECPYCGQRLRKRAPKIERGDAPGGGRGKGLRRGRTGTPTKPRKARAKPHRPGLGPLRTGEIPGIRGDEFARPIATIALVAIGALWWLALIPLRDQAISWIVDPLGTWWGVLVAPFVHLNGWYQFAALGAVGIYGWMLERRHGPVPMLLVWLLTASGGMAIVKAVDAHPFAMGASGGALGLLCAWAVPVLLARRRRGDNDDEADLLATGVIFVALALMPLARDEVSAVATLSGIVIGSLCGLVLHRLAPRD